MAHGFINLSTIILEEIAMPNRNKLAIGFSKTAITHGSNGKPLKINWRATNAA